MLQAIHGDITWEAEGGHGAGRGLQAEDSRAELWEGKGIFVAGTKE